MPAAGSWTIRTPGIWERFRYEQVNGQFVPRKKESVAPKVVNLGFMVFNGYRIQEFRSKWSHTFILKFLYSIERFSSKTFLPKFK
jgi:hypothetical protein